MNRVRLLWLPGRRAPRTSGACLPASLQRTRHPGSSGPSTALPSLASTLRRKGGQSWCPQGGGAQGEEHGGSSLGRGLPNLPRAVVSRAPWEHTAWKVVILALKRATEKKTQVGSSSRLAKLSSLRGAGGGQKQPAAWGGAEGRLV